MDRWREIINQKGVFSKGRLKFFDGFTHSIIKPHKTCTTQLFSSIGFEFPFPIYCLMAPRKLVKRDFMI